MLLRDYSHTAQYHAAARCPQSTAVPRRTHCPRESCATSHRVMHVELVQCRCAALVRMCRRAIGEHAPVSPFSPLSPLGPVGPVAPDRCTNTAVWAEPAPPPTAHVAWPQRAARHVHSRHANRTVAQSAAPPMQPQPHPRARQRRSSRWRTSVALVTLGAGVALVALRSIFPSGACTRTHQRHALGCPAWALSQQATHRSQLRLLPQGRCTATRPTAARRVPTANRRSTDPKSVQQAVRPPQATQRMSAQRRYLVGLVRRQHHFCH